MKDNVKIGSLWSNDTGYGLTVRDIVVDADGTWVHYGYHGNDTTYSCLIDAFAERFTYRIQ